MLSRQLQKLSLTFVATMACLAGCASAPASQTTLTAPPTAVVFKSAYPTREAMLDDRRATHWTPPNYSPNAASLSELAGEAPLKLCAPKPSATRLASDTELAVIVTGKAGDAIRNLKQTDFVVYSASRRFPIDQFADNSAAPISVVIVIDSSESMQTKFASLQKTLGKFLTSLNACDEVAILSFAASATNSNASASTSVLEPFTTDTALASTRLESVKPSGQTPLYDAVERGLGLLAVAHYPNRALIVITDGMDNQSATSKEAMMEAVRKSGWPVYAVGIGDPNSPSTSISIGPIKMVDGSDHLDVAVLKDIASASGGRSFMVPSMRKDNGQAFMEAITAIGGLLGGGYAIGVSATNASGWSIDQPPFVSVPSHPDATIRVKVVRVMTQTAAP